MHGSSANPLVRTPLTWALAIGMVAANLWSETPVQACICADGRVEPFCNTAFCRSAPGGTSRQARRTCGCACCANRGACCEGRAGCGAKSSIQPAGACVAAGDCCRPFVKARDSLPVVTAPAMPDWAVEAASASAAVFGDVVQYEPHRVSVGSAHPPADLVVALQRFLI